MILQMPLCGTLYLHRDYGPLLLSPMALNSTHESRMKSSRGPVSSSTCPTSVLFKISYRCCPALEISLTPPHRGRHCFMHVSQTDSTKHQQRESRSSPSKMITKYKRYYNMGSSNFLYSFLLVGGYGLEFSPLTSCPFCGGGPSVGTS